MNTIKKQNVKSGDFVRVVANSFMLFVVSVCFVFVFTVVYVGFNEPDIEVCLVNGTFNNLTVVKNGSHEPEFSVSIEVNASSSRPTEGEEELYYMNNTVLPVSSLLLLFSYRLQIIAK